MESVEVIARGAGIKIRRYLQKRFGGRNWRKLKGIVVIEEENGYFGKAEVHWFEAHGVGRVEWKIKKRFSAS